MLIFSSFNCLMRQLDFAVRFEWIGGLGCLFRLVCRVRRVEVEVEVGVGVFVIG